MFNLLKWPFHIAILSCKMAKQIDSWCTQSESLEKQYTRNVRTMEDQYEDKDFHRQLEYSRREARYKDWLEQRDKDLKEEVAKRIRIEHQLRLVQLRLLDHENVTNEGRPKSE